MMKITLDYPPSSNCLYATVRGRRVLSKEGRLYKAKAAQMAINAGCTPLSGFVVFCIDVFRPIKSGDLDNRIKIVQDSLKGVAWDDDKQVVEIHARRFDDKENPRVEVSISAAGDLLREKETSTR